MNQSKQRARAAVYTRVSSDEQAKGYSLTFQQDEIKEIVLKDGAILNDLNIYVDDGYTGITGNRPALKAMTEAAKRKEIDVIYVWKIDRLFRNTKLVLNLVDDLAVVGVGVKSILEPFCDSSTAVGRYMFTMMAAGAEMEHANINERTQHGKLRAMKEGKWLGEAPYGYRGNEETKKLEIYEIEAKWVRKFYEWLVNDRLSLYQIQMRVHEFNIPSKFDNLGRHKPVNRKNFWARRTLGRILTNELYTGVHVYRKYKNPGNVESEANLRPRDEWIEIEVPPVISKEIFEAAQRQLDINRERSPRRMTKLYMFAKKLQCGVCRGRMHAYQVKPRVRKDGTRKQDYKFYGGSWLTKTSTDRKCANCTNYNEEHLGTPIWDGIVGILSRPEWMMSKLDVFRKKGMGQDNLAELKAEYEKKSLDLQNKIQRLLDAYLEGEVDKDLYRSKLADLEHHKKEIEEQKRRIEGIMLSKEEKIKRIVSAKMLYKQIHQKLEQANYEKRCQIINLLVENVVLRGRNAEVEVNLPVKELVPNVATELFREPAGAGVSDTLWDRGGVDRAQKYFGTGGGCFGMAAHESEREDRGGI
jgi:site-specific DNA recombinase